MGTMRFILPPSRIDDDIVRHAYLSGADLIPWQTRARRDDGQLVLQQTPPGSCRLHVPWHVAGHGALTLTTATLGEPPESSEPYQLPLELARGVIGQLRRQMAEWQGIGLVVPDTLHEKIGQAVLRFGQAAVGMHDSEASVQSACEAIEMGVDATCLLVGVYAEQALTVRRRNGARLSTFLGADLGHSLPNGMTTGLFRKTFNAANVGLAWRHIETTEEDRDWRIADRQIEWCRANKLTVCAGPLLMFDQRAIPDWLTLYDEDFDSIFTFVSEFIRDAVGRYRGRVQLWQAAGRVNTADLLGLTAEERLRLTAHAVELIRRLDPDTPVVVSLDQPWAEYLIPQRHDLAPIQFADALVQADLGLAGLVLEMNLGYCPGGSLPRDPLQLCRLLDSWSLLGLPVVTRLVLPSEQGDDPLAQQSIEVSPGMFSPQTQEAWLARNLPVLLAKSFVHGVLYGQLLDAEPRGYPHGGLFDHRGQPKPALSRLATIRQEHLR